MLNPTCRHAVADYETQSAALPIIGKITNNGYSCFFLTRLGAGNLVRLRLAVALPAQPNWRASWTLLEDSYSSMCGRFASTLSSMPELVSVAGIISHFSGGSIFSCFIFRSAQVGSLTPSPPPRASYSRDCFFHHSHLYVYFF